MDWFTDKVVIFFLGVGTTWLLGWVKTIRDELHERIDDACEDILAAAESATEYWTLKENSENSDNSNRIKVLEASIVGVQFRIQGLLDQLAEERWHIKDQLDDLLTEFCDSLSGGDFQVVGREPDFERALSCQTISSQMVNELRRIRRSWIKSIVS